MTTELLALIIALSERLGVSPYRVMPFALDCMEAAPDVRQTVMEIEDFWEDGEALAGRPHALEEMNKLLPFIAVARLASNAGIGATVH